MSTFRNSLTGENVAGPPRTWIQIVAPYVAIARPDHWFKNVFMLAGLVLAMFYSVGEAWSFTFVKFAISIIATCLVASSNYVINEILDARTDLDHPEKKNRPIPSGRVILWIAYVEWLGLGAVGLGLAWLINLPFFYAALWLWVMGVIYNVPPVRSKELPYGDVISESVNNPIRLLLGWFVISPLVIPPLSLILAYWMVGAFFMASKRYAEYRWIGDPQVAAAYRRSFRHYNDERLLVSMFFYAASAALMLGVFIIRYKLELLLCVPLIAGFFSYYMHVTLKQDSPVQNPERLYCETGLMIYLAICVVAFFGLLFVEVPVLYEWFNVAPSRVKVLWSIGGV
jgi:decaprenyl-phosphate phosphoribosyltransferase